MYFVGSCGIVVPNLFLFLGLLCFNSFNYSKSDVEEKEYLSQ
jgi:hypothetical protein